MGTDDALRARKGDDWGGNGEKEKKIQDWKQDPRKYLKKNYKRERKSRLVAPPTSLVGYIDSA